MKLLQAARHASWSIAMALALAHAANAAPPARPFKASLDLTHAAGRLTRCPGTEGQPGGGGVLHGSGHATHLGQVQVSGQHCIEARQDRLYVFNGDMALTAANGDVVLADYTGYLTQESPGIYAFDGQYIIKDGTGRFENASGMGTLTGTFQGDFQAQAVSLTANGRIKY